MKNCLAQCQSILAEKIMIRITGGEFRSRLLKTPSCDTTKPTMDKVRLGVFSAIGDKIVNADVLDLFAGCGSYGFESLSRGASSATFVDNNSEPILVIKDNAKTLGLNVDTYLGNVVTFLKESKNRFDLIFVDPPYKLVNYQEIIDLVLENNILTDFGIIILESELPLNIKEEQFQKVKMYKYGLAKVYILRK